MSFKFCPECGYKLEKEYKFCPECGYKLAEQGKAVEQKKEDAKQVKSAKPDLSEAKEYQSARELFERGEFDEALPKIKKFAEKGEVEAQFMMGCYYDPGVEFCPGSDGKQAFYWYTKAAAQGHAHAMSNLAACYECGVGVEQNLKVALYWAQRAVECGDKSDSEMFSVFLDDLKERIANNTAGKEESAKPLTKEEQDKENLKYAENLYYQKKMDLIFPMVKEYAEQGNAQGQWLLGMCYCGQALETPYEDPEKCIYWFKKSAEQGNTSAMCFLGMCYQYGYGVKEDLNEARRLCQKALELGDKVAKEFLDLMDTEE